jgi:hypothetical protein
VPGARDRRAPVPLCALVPLRRGSLGARRAAVDPVHRPRHERFARVVDGRDGAAVRAFLRNRPLWWRHRVQVIAIAPSAAFRAALLPLLPHARGPSTTSTS